MMPQVNEYVAAVYEGKWYIGKVVDIDENEREVEIDFMESRKCLFQWPRIPDLIWLKSKKILCQINAPVATGKSQRMFQMSNDDKDKIIKLYSALKQ